MAFLFDVNSSPIYKPIGIQPFFRLNPARYNSPIRQLLAPY